MNLRRFVVIGLLLALPVVVNAQQKKKVYLDPDNSFSACFSAALQKKQVPVTVTMDPKRADYAAQFQAKDKNGAALSLLNRPEPS